MGGTHIVGKAGYLAEVSSEGAVLTTPRSNSNVSVFALAARTATVSSADITNYFGRACHVYIKVTDSALTPSVVFTIEGKDEVSGDYYTILAAAAMTGAAVKILRVVPGLTAAANLIASDVLPRTWRVTATHADTDSITYSVGASVIL
jgi:hypothetical protein